MSSVREHLGLLWLSRRALMTSNPHEDAAWAAVAAYFVRAHLDELIEIMGGADIEGWARLRAGEIPVDFPYSVAPQAATTASACPTCKGNDADMPCTYPSEGKPGCLRDARLATTASASGAVCEHCGDVGYFKDESDGRTVPCSECGRQ